MSSGLYQQWVQRLKTAWYAGRGEPYYICGQKLRFVPGTRPVRLKYAQSTNVNARYDALQIKLIIRDLKPGDTAIDIGAHAGEYCILMSALCGQTGRIVAFEPEPYAREQLFRNLLLNPDINQPIVERFALSDVTGVATLYSNGGNAQSSLARSGMGHRHGRSVEKINVPVVTLDEYLADNDIPEPSLVKIDTEGAEIRILKGAAQLLRGNAKVICELHPYAWEEFGNSLAELKALAKSADRRIRYLDQQNEIGGDAFYGAVAIERH